ncbi:sialin-like [Tropilaelaps mercedesae]|uniref:Sialin-like n=1 Tax=Tropilaelaps mercedesae TaxID=418985 RepID=A0A1V9X3B4_9ACAR|nr:sialin-like [Tropilaelaps mercedesae]
MTCTHMGGFCGIVVETLGANALGSSQFGWPSAVWSLHLALFRSLYLQVTLITEVLIYMTTVLYPGIHKNGLISPLPSIAAIIGGVITAPTDRMVARRKMSVTTLRKLTSCVALVVLSIALFLIVVVARCDIVISAAFMIAGLFRGIFEAGVSPVAIDIAPESAGTILGSITVTCGAFGGVIVPLVTGEFVRQANTMTRWSYDFYVAGTVGLTRRSYF